MRIAASLAIVLAGATGVRAQSVASRVAAAPDGWVQMRFASREGICGNGRGLISTGGNNLFGSVDELPKGDWRTACQPGPVRVVLAVRGGRVVGLRTHVGGEAEDRLSPLTDIGTVSARAAVDFLLGLASGSDARPAEQAVLPAALADSVVIVPALLRIARDDRAPRGVKHEAYFWLGRAAASVATGIPDTQLDEDDPGGHGEGESAVRVQAVFALSQLPHNQGVPELIQVARTHRDPHVVRSALFWLSQSGDSRALDLFEQILRRR